MKGKYVQYINVFISDCQIFYNKICLILYQNYLLYIIEILMIAAYAYVIICIIVNCCMYVMIYVIKIVFKFCFSIFPLFSRKHKKKQGQTL